jgi:hypothetical protein
MKKRFPSARRGRFTRRKPRDTRPFKPGWFELVLDLLRSYASRTGHTCVPAGHREGGFPLGWMVVYLRARYRRDLLSPERIRKLERCAGWSWDPVQDQFEKRLRLLQRLVRRQGHACVRKADRPEGFDLHHWIENQRRRHRQGRLPKERSRALEAVPGWSWHGDSRERRFEEILSALRAFARRHGHTRVRSGTRAGVRLDRWIVLQRQLFREHRLSRAHIRALAALPGWSWEPQANRFEEGVRHLLRYVSREGHACVPQDRGKPGFKLGLWVMSVRQRYRRGRLAPDRARRLERLPGWTWNVRKRRSLPPAPR